MSWGENTPLEKHVEWLLRYKLKSDGENLWAQYVATRNEISTQILPWIGTQEPNLSDHGIPHIRDVMENACLLLGFQGEYGADCERDNEHNLSAEEMLILLLGILVHDIGNIRGRKAHNQAISEVWSRLTSWNCWSTSERRLVNEIGRAHTGKKDEASFDDTLATLGLAHFRKKTINCTNIAAIIRIADELAEGPQRTSSFLVDSGLIGEDSQIHHQYALVTEPAGIDRTRGLISLNYEINLDKFDQITLRNLLEVIYSRALKLNFERRYTRHYSSILLPFKETSLSINFVRGNREINADLSPISLKDFNSNGFHEVQNNYLSIFKNLNSAYDIDVLMDRLTQELL